MSKISVGQIVQYCMTKDDAEQVNRRRTTGREIAERIVMDKWPRGAQAHMGNTAHEGDVLPMLVVRVWPDVGDPGHHCLNGQVFLDGNDVLWVMSIAEGEMAGGKAPLGKWVWPVIQ